MPMSEQLLGMFCLKGQGVLLPSYYSISDTAAIGRYISAGSSASLPQL
jgi:hypothetical protein